MAALTADDFRGLARQVARRSGHRCRPRLCRTTLYAYLCDAEKHMQHMSAADRAQAAVIAAAAEIVGTVPSEGARAEAPWPAEAGRPGGVDARARAAEDGPPGAPAGLPPAPAGLPAAQERLSPVVWARGAHAAAAIGGPAGAPRAFPLVADAAHRTSGSRFRFTVRVHSDVRAGALVGARPGVLIIPGEPVPRPGATAPPASSHRFSFDPMPYVTVRLSELPSAGSGSDAGMLGAFCHYVVDSVVCVPGSRASLRMKPATAAELAFPAPLPCPSALEVTIERHGAALNGSDDTNRVAGVSYDVTGNRDSLAVTLVAPFDGNEFQPGDSVRLSGVRLSAAGGEPDVGARDAEQFLNRPEGHVVLRVHPPTTAQDLSSTFYIRAPGRYDGHVFQSDERVREAVLAAHAAGPPAGGRVMNLSAQPLLALDLVAAG